MRAPRIAVLVAVAVLLVACPEGPEAKGGAESGVKQWTEEPAPQGVPEPETPPPSAGELDPLIREVASAGQMPSAIRIELARAVVGPERLGTPPGEGTVLRIQPRIDGDLRFTSPSTLTFLPTGGFAPGTDYEVALEALALEGATVRAPMPNPWIRRFTTPEFAFLGLQVRELDFVKHEAVLELVFSAPVDRSELRRGARITLNGDKPRRLNWESDESGGERVRLTDPRIRAGVALAFELPSGAGSRDRAARTPALAATTTIQGGPSLDIKDVYPAEGGSGFHVEVVCNDNAVEEKRYHWWDRARERSWYDLSRRCVLDAADAAESIRFEPALAFTVSPSGGGFRILGDFQRGSYTLRVGAGARTLDGGTLYGAYERTFSVPARSPQVHFVAQGRYLPRKAWQQLPVRHLNVDSLRLVVRHVPPENLVFWMSDEGSERAGERTSNVVFDETLPVRGEADRITTSWIDVGSKLPGSTKGLLEVSVRGGPASDVARILLTELHLVAKRVGVHAGRPHGSQLLVWALGMEDGAPVTGVEIELLKKSGKRVGSCFTSGGACTIDLPEKDLDPSPPFALLAKKAGDLTYLKFADLAVEVEDARVQGEPFVSEQKYRAAVYGDRGVYRPGETAHLVAVVREDGGEAAPMGMPVDLEVRDPRGKVFKRATLKVNEAGLVSRDVAFAAFAATGRYEAKVMAGKRPLGTWSFQVEEFVPERMKVDAAAARPHWLRTEAVGVEVEARYLFGGVPADHRVEVTCELIADAFAPKEHANFHYGVWRQGGQAQRPLALGTLTGALDEKGLGRFECPVGSGGGFEGPARLVARAAVFESGSGRTTVGRATASVHPEPHYVGLATPAQKVAAGERFPVSGVVVDWEGKLVPGVEEVELELVRLESEYGWYYDDENGDESWRRWQRPVVESRTKVPVKAGRFQTELTPQTNADGFLVRARLGQARTDLEVQGKGGWWWSAEESRVDRTPKPGKPTWIALEAPSSAKVGEKFVVTFKAPWAGRALLAVETDRVLTQQWRTVEAGEQRWELSVDAFVPNVYVTAFLVKDPRLESAEAFLPDRAYGVESVRIEPTAYTQAVALEVPSEVRSGSRLEVSLDLGKVEGKTFATVAAVDEGILSLTGFKTPDPLGSIFVRRALGVQTYETIGWTLLTPPGGPSGSTGGDEGGSLGRVQPVKPVALWSGVVEVGADGKAKVGFDLPPYRGQLRIMAVTAGPKRLGRAEAKVVVRDPLVVQATLPRFLTRGDELEIPVFVTNLSGRARDVTVRLSAENLPVPGFAASEDAPPPVLITGRDEKALTLEDGKGGVVVFKALVRGAAGAARLTVAARSGELSSKEEAQVPVLPAGPKERRLERIALEAGRVDLTPHLTGWEPMSEQTTFWVTGNPYGDAFDHLKHLVRYPYGCLEQTTSSTRPLLYLSELVSDLDPGLVASGKLEDMVLSGIDRIFAMQTPSGGFAYWPGGTEPTHWGSAYAAHLLLDAQKAGYPVPQERLDEALAWMESELTNRFERADGAQGRDHHYGNAEPYLHYVLASAGRGRKARVQRLLEAGVKGEAAGEERYMLQAALWLAGDRRYEAQLKKPDLSPVGTVRRMSWTYYSDRRARGFMLSTFQDLFGNDTAGEGLANVVAESLRGQASGWYTTQELVWGLTGLGKRVAGQARGFAEPVLTASGKRVAAQPRAKGAKSSDRTFALTRASEHGAVELTIPGKGEGRLYLILSSEGVRTNPTARTGGEGLRITRRWVDAEGQEIALQGGSHALGQMVYVELTLTNGSGDRLTNVALVDRLPGGWEIENPRLGRGSAPAWVDHEAAWEPDHMNVRDDRVEIFGSLASGESRTVVYGARAVTAGRFTVPPAEAEAMYDPGIWARDASRTVEIAGPWADYLN